MIEAGVEPLNDLIAALHTKLLVAELERVRAEPKGREADRARRLRGRGRPARLAPARGRRRRALSDGRARERLGRGLRRGHALALTMAPFLLEDWLRKRRGPPAPAADSAAAPAAR